MAMDETLASEPIRKRLSLQNEVLKWLVEFSEKLETRAKGTAAELNGLLDQAGVVELDMKNTINSFNSLCRHRCIDHKISDDDGMPADMKENTRTSVQVQVPAQDYELDILPRYKEALSLGLTSCKNHLRSKGRSTSSIFRAMPAYSPLPHIIGSEEYLHDNSCGLMDDFTSRSLPADFVLDSKGASSDLEVPDLFSSHMLGAQQGSNKDETDPLVSAAQDFKAMLEAALLNPYKFYDEESVLAHDPTNDNRSAEHTDESADLGTSKGPEDASSNSLEQQNVIEEHLTYLEDPQVHSDHELYSALVTGSLFDGEDESPFLNQEEPSDVPPSISGSLSAPERTADSGVSHEKTLSESQSSSSSQNGVIQNNTDASISNEEEENGKKDSEENIRFLE